ncbi:MAG TPA: DEAD/DEAH box helicase [Bacteroidia bacterium]|nr:DEAD/DEAH box helicase [Bacteroidia bacterium]
MNTFEELGISGEIIKSIAELGFEKPTPIQVQSIPVLMTGTRDFIGLAQTGTGKTAAFGIPLLQLLDFNSKKTQALILAPTRELCVQIAKDIVNYSKNTSEARVVAVYGGASIQGQISEIKRGAQIVVATPGRLLDLIGRRAIDISLIQFVVLDEADEMLNMGFQEDIDEILENTPAEKQTWLFSATMPDEVRRIAKKYMENPFELTVGKKNTGADNIEHHYYVVHARDRYAALKRIVDATPDIFAIVFCRTKIETQEVAENLIRDGYNADSLHGDLSQQQRDKVMKRYREKSLQLLIATDVAARGIDVNDVTHVINYNLPDELESYTHRSGRTARAGKSGISICIINTKEVFKIRQIEKMLNKKFVFSKIPTGVEICEKQLLGLIKKIHDVAVDEQGIAKYLPSIIEELSELDKEELIKRVVSIEFNRFLEYYRNANDLNIDFSKKDHVRGGDEKYRSGAPRMFINLGSMDGFDTGKMLGYLIDITNLPKTVFGRIDIKGVYSFVDIENEKIQDALNSFKNEVYKGRRVRVDISTGPGGNKTSPGRSERSYGSARPAGRERSFRGEKSGRGERPDSGKWQDVMEKSGSWENKNNKGGGFRKRSDDREKRKRKKSY